MARDPLYFGRMCIPDLFSVKSPDFHAEIVRTFLKLEEKNHSYVAPRGHAKSSLVACVLVLWHVFLEDYYRYLTDQLISETPIQSEYKIQAALRALEMGKIRYLPHRPKYTLLIGKAQGEAILKLETIKDTLGQDNILGESNRLFDDVFGHNGQKTSHQWTTENVLLRKGDFFQAVGTGQMVRGKKKKHQRPTLICVDDPEDEENTATAERMLSNMEWLTVAIMPAVDAHTGRVVVIGTPLNHACMVASLSENPAWETRWFTNDRESGELLWPWYITKKSLDKKYEEAKAKGKVGVYYREHEAKIMGDENQIFRPDFVQYWTGRLKRDLVGNPYLEVESQAKCDARGKATATTFPKPKNIPVNIYIGVDPASATNERADYTVIFVIGIDEDLNRWCIDIWRRRERPSNVAAKLVEMYKHYKPFKTYIETIAFQEMLRDDVQRRMEEEGIYIPGLETKNTTRTRKSDRIEGLEPEFSARKVFVHARAIETSGMVQTNFNSFVDELTLFPFAKKDDTLDAYWYARKRVLPPQHELILEEEKLEEVRTYYDWMV
jgi:predicted phage terminase large subunit-like protein